MKLTVPQLLALVDLKDANKPIAAYQIGVSPQVLRRLGGMGLAQCLAGSGLHASWHITESGRRALTEDTSNG